MLTEFAIADAPVARDDIAPIAPSMPGTLNIKPIFLACQISRMGQLNLLPI